MVEDEPKHNIDLTKATNPNKVHNPIKIRITIPVVVISLVGFSSFSSFSSSVDVVVSSSYVGVVVSSSVIYR